jgi:hypothetical protein
VRGDLAHLPRGASIASARNADESRLRAMRSFVLTANRRVVRAT